MFVKQLKLSERDPNTEENQIDSKGKILVNPIHAVGGPDMQRTITYIIQEYLCQELRRGYVDFDDEDGGSRLSILVKPHLKIKEGKELKMGEINRYYIAFWEKSVERAVYHKIKHEGLIAGRQKLMPKTIGSITGDDEYRICFDIPLDTNYDSWIESQNIMYACRANFGTKFNKTWELVLF